MMMFSQRRVALLLSCFGPSNQFFAALARLRLGLPTRDRLCPGVSPSCDGVGSLWIDVGSAVEVCHFACGANDRLANGLGLEERPQVRGLDVVAQCVRLRAFGHGLDKGQKQGQYRNEQRDFLITFDMPVTMCSGHLLSLRV